MIKHLSLAAVLLSVLSTGFADDLDDGIALDTPINDDLQLDINVDFIKRNAKAKARRGAASRSGCQGAGNQTFGPGANLKGATIVNLSNNQGSSTVCIQD
jgi:hypothetical protein